MTEQNLEINRTDIQNPILPNININQIILQSNETQNQKEETKLTPILKLSQESDRHNNSDNLNETERSNKKNEKNDTESKQEETKITKPEETKITKPEETKNTNPINIMDNLNSLNNKLYFTEAIIPSNPNKVIEDNTRGSKLYTIDVIPENPAKTNLNTKSIISNKTPKNQINKFVLNNLSPEIELRKRISNKSKFEPFRLKIKAIEDQMIKQNEYDFKKVMKDLQMEYKQKLKMKQREKLIHKKNEKFQNKLKQMEEFRNNLINEKLLKLEKKQSNSKKKKKIKNLYISPDEKININKRMEKNHSSMELSNSEKDNYCFPSIQNLSRLELIKLKQKMNEDEFCKQSLQRIQENEEKHKINHEQYLKSINYKFKKQDKLYRQRSYNCLRKVRLEDYEFKENMMIKQMVKSYTIGKLIRKIKNARKIKLNKSLTKTNNIKEKQEMIEQQLEQRFLDYQKKLKNETNFIDKKLFKLNSCITEKQQKKIKFNKLHKQNLREVNNEMENFYRDIMLRQEDNVMILNEIIKEEGNNREEIIKRTIREQIQKSKEMEDLIKFRDKMKNENINNFNSDKIKKIFDEKRIEEQNKLAAEKWLAKL